MTFRSLLTCLTLLLCLLRGQTATGHEIPREVARVQPERADLTRLERRLAELEKQLDLLMKEVEALREESKPLAAEPAAPPEVRIFHLRNADAAETVETLQQLFQADEARKIRIAGHQSANSVVVRAGHNDLEMVEAIVIRLDEAAAEVGAAEGDAEPRKARTHKRPEEIKHRVAVAESDVAMWRDRVAWSERMAKKGYLTDFQVNADRGQLIRAEFALDQAQEELQGLTPDRKQHVENGREREE
jgi:hypothetical protein